MLWLDLEESGFESDGLRKLDYCDMLVKFANMGMYTLIKLLVTLYPLERFYDPQIYCVYITFLKLHMK